MKENFLYQIGFSENEAKVYMALLELGDGIADEIAKLAGVSRPTAYSILRKLIDRNLVAEVAGKPLRFQVFPPEQTLDELIQKKIEEIKHLSVELPQMATEFIKEAKKIYGQQSDNIYADRDLMILRGSKTINKAVASVEVRKEIRLITRPPLVLPKDEKQIEMSRQQSREFADEGIIQYMLCETDMLKEPSFMDAVKFYLKIGFPVRHLSSLPAKSVIIDNSACLMVIRTNKNPEDVLSVFVRNRDFVKFSIEGFNSLWNRAKPVGVKK